MPTPDDITGRAFMAYNGRVMLPGLIIHSSTFWPLHPLAGPSLNLFARAVAAGLDQVTNLSPAAITGIFRTPCPGWRAIGDPDGGQLRIRDGRGLFEVRTVAVTDPPQGWWDLADIAERLLLLVTDQPLDLATDQPLDRSTGRDPGRDLAEIAGEGRMVGAAVDFGASDVPVAPLPDDTVPRVLVDPVGAVITLADNVQARIITMAEARSRLRSLSDFLDHELVAAGLSEEELARRLVGEKGPGPDERVGFAYAVARLVTEFAELRDSSRTSRLWRDSADRTVTAGVRAMAGGHDPAIFADVAGLSGLRLAQLRDSAPPGQAGQLAGALQSALLLRLAALGPQYAGGDDYALAEGLANCVAGGVICAAQTGQTGLPPDPGDCLDQAWELLNELLLLSDRGDQIKAVALNGLLQYELGRANPKHRNRGLLAGVTHALSEMTDAGTDPVLPMLIARLQYSPGAADVGQRVAIIAGALARPADELRARHGDLITRQVCSQAIAAAREMRSVPLLIQALAWSDSLPPPVAGADARQIWEARGHCLPDDPTPCPEPAADLRALASAYRARHPEWTDRQRAEALLHLAAHARAAADPGLGLALLDEVGPRFNKTHPMTFLLLSADLHLQLALDGGGRAIGRAGGAGMAAGGYAGLGLLELSGTCLMMLASMLSGRDPADRELALLSAVGTLPQLRSSRDPVLSRTAHDLAHRAVLTALADHAPFTVQVALHQAAKGADFAAARIERDGVTLPLQIATLRSEWELLSTALAAFPLDPKGNEPGDARLDARAYVDYGESAEGSDLAQIEGNQRRHLDHLITRALLDSRYTGEFRVESITDVQRRLDDRTVLLSYFLPDRQAADRDVCVLLALTREEVTGSVIISDRTPDMTDVSAGRSRQHVLSIEVAEVQQAITEEDPLFGVIGEDTARLLGRADRIFGDPATLSRWRGEGKDRLCIWAHGPLHHLPFHLYTVDDEPVAAHWTVTAIPGLESLPGYQPRRGGPIRPRRTLVVGYGDSPDHSQADVDKELREHATEVAALSGSAALVGREATRSRFLTELRDADIIHIAAHGVHDPTAPWFDCLRLHPDREDDGRVFACDLLAADLRGVRLVTLAACDSALGRFDLNDNLRGIPAGFLLAGAQAVVGCLWPVQPAPATMFFGYLHRSLAEGAEPLSAFRAAQLAARQQFPQYRHWGAFSFQAGQ